MDALFILFVITAVLALLGAAATTLGVDTRDGFGTDAAPRAIDTVGRGLG